MSSPQEPVKIIIQIISDLSKRIVTLEKIQNTCEQWYKCSDKDFKYYCYCVFFNVEKENDDQAAINHKDSTVRFMQYKLSFLTL